MHTSFIASVYVQEVYIVGAENMMTSTVFLIRLCVVFKHNVFNRPKDYFSFY